MKTSQQAMKPAFLRVTPGQARTEDGLIIFRLAIWLFENVARPASEIGHLYSVSGQPGCQRLLTAAERKPGSGCPTPEGRYLLGDPDATRRMNWAGEPGDYSKLFPVPGAKGLGPVWIGIHPAPENPCQSHDFGLHGDWNSRTSPGSDGCVTTQPDFSAQDEWTRLKTVVWWFNHYDVQQLVVDLGLGTVPGPHLIHPL